MNKASTPRTILITGATSGFGEAMARRFAAGGWRTIITGRRADRLDALVGELRTAHNAELLALRFDVRDRAAVQAALTELPEAWRTIDVLVNNAGLAAGLAPIHEGDPDDWDTMLDTNVKGLLYVSRAVMPGMVARGRGHIINIGSIAGRQVYPKGNVYCATKHAVHALSQAMRQDLLPYGIKVTEIAPGMAETEFSLVRYGGDAARAKQVYQGVEPLVGHDIAELAWFAANLPAHVCINDLEVTPLAQASAGLVQRAG